MNRTAKVSQIGKFFKVITNDGEDISNQIERPMRKRAIELGKELEFDTKNSCWMIPGESNVKTPAMKKVSEKKPVSLLDKIDELTAPISPKRKRKVYDTVEMPRPKWEPGDNVMVEFLGQPRNVVLSEIGKNPTNINRWIYSGVEVGTGLLIPFIGINGSEQFANIIEEKEAE